MNPFTDPTVAQPLSGYIFFYGHRRVEIKAATSADAHTQAIAYFKAPKSKQHLVHGVLAERPNGEPVVHSTAAI